MSRYHLIPTPVQEAVLRGRTSAPGYLEQCRQLTRARAEHPWLAAGSQTVQ